MALQADEYRPVFGLNCLADRDADVLEWNAFAQGPAMRDDKPLGGWPHVDLDATPVAREDMSVGFSGGAAD